MDIKKLLEMEGIDMSYATIKRTLIKAGLKGRKKRKTFLLTDKHKKKRL